MSDKHTPGPWAYGVRTDGSIWLSIGDHKTGPHHQGDLVATPEDARLIAAAPDLLALVIRYRNETPLGNQPHMIAHEADAVIARATGAAS